MFYTLCYKVLRQPKFIFAWSSAVDYNLAYFLLNIWDVTNLIFLGIYDLIFYKKINDLLDDDVKLDQPELPEEEENMEDPEYKQDIEPRDTMESILESCSVAASTRY